MVVESVRDDPVRLRPPRYAPKQAAPDRIAVAAGLSRIALVITDQHEIHHVQDRGYDFIVVDPSSVDSVAAHMHSREFFREASRALTPGGVLAMNAMGLPGGSQLAAVQATLKSVFPHVRAFRAHASQRCENAVFFASRAPLRLPAEAEAGCAALEAEYGTEGRILTDDCNPIDVLSAALGPAVRSHPGRY